MGMRIERAAALLACQQANLNRKTGAPARKISEFMTHEAEPETTMGHAMETWG
ncbi:hypothetical protein [Vreelandella sp. GE22]